MTGGRVIVVGAGLAGLSCCLTLAREGVSCTLVSTQPSERAQSVMAEGGINAALDLMGQTDDPSQHFEDTLRGGCFLADPNAVWGMVREAPDIVRDLRVLGVPFNTEHGHMVQRAFGGQSKMRTAFAKSSTGKALVTALVDAVRRYEAEGLVERRPHHVLSALDVAGGRCCGAWITNMFTGGVSHLAGPAVLATGGLSGIFGSLTTGSVGNTGDVAALALEAGVELANLEFVQYHPTTVRISGKRLLVSEAARGEGGRLYALRDSAPWYFMEELHPSLGNLMPRDVVSREEARVLSDPSCTGEVWLDMRGISRNVWRSRLSDLREECIHYLSVDPAREPVPVEPGIHYSMGGIWVDEAHRTSMGGLYAAGECCSQYHGANRLGGNSLLGAIYGGRVAARTVMRAETPLAGDSRAATQPSVSPKVDPALPLPPDVALESQMHRVLGEALGVVRDGDTLRAAAEELDGMDFSACSKRLARRHRLARAMVACALNREESRGAHWRTDFPETRDEFRRTKIVRLVDGELRVSLRDLPEVREGVPSSTLGVSLPASGGPSVAEPGGTEVRA